MFGSFSNEALSAYVAMVTEKGQYSFSEASVYDFTRCLRTDGSYYGTAGQCRKGTTAPPKEKAEPQGYKPKHTGSEGKKGVKHVSNITDAMRENYGVRDPFNPGDFEKDLAELKANNPPPQILADRSKALELDIGHAKVNKKFLDELEKNLPSDTSLITSGQNIYIETTTPSGDKVVTYYSPKNGYNFNINNASSSVDANVKTRKAQMEAASVARQHYDAVVQALPPGAVLHTQAYNRDGKGEARQRIYERMGFSSAKPPGNIYAVKQPDGSMAPSSEGGWNQQSKNPDSLWFTEQSDKEKDEMWRILLFGK